MSTQYGYFLIADITGYTQYLSASELDHAQRTLTTLLNLVIHHTKAPLVISRLAGDAVISYGLREGFLQGQTFAETIEDTYVDFRQALEMMVHNTTCTCNACRNIGTLDLKFFVHYGQFAIQKLDAHDELVGSDVNLLHRLLKNHVTERTGFKAYTLYTDAALQQLGLADGRPQLVANEESYENFDVVKTWIQDMHPVWQRRKRDVQVTIGPEQELVRESVDVELAPKLVWDYLVQPEHHNVLMGATRLDVGGRAGGRISAGSVYQCYHGDAVVPLTVLTWQPFERITMQFVAPVPIKGTTAMTEIRLEESGPGTRLTQILSKSAGPLLGRLMADAMLKMMTQSTRHDLDRFKAHIEADYASHSGNLPVQSDIPAAAIAAAAMASLRQAPSP